MSPAHRKLTMQLTPLLDLLLIVIFAQYMEMRESAGAATENVSALQLDLQTARAETVELQASLAEASRLLDASAQTMNATQAMLERQHAERAAQDSRLLRAEERQQLLGRLMVDLFQVPPNQVEALLDPNRIPPVTASSQEYAELRERFQQMANDTPQEMIRHLLTFEEVRKRCDIWELRLSQDPRELLIHSAKEQRRMTLPLENGEDFAALDGSAFERELYAEFKSLPQPKGLVLVTLTYDFDLRENLLGPAKMGVEYVLERLRVEYAGRSQFEFADLGILKP